MKKLLFLIIVSFTSFFGVCQTKAVAWDNTSSSNWGSDFQEIIIPSSADAALQHAWFYKSKGNDPQPLIISLHTWSGDYNQEDPLANEVLLRDWNYIHPDFRGTNNKPEACGSQLVISDLEDAIAYAVRNGNVDTANVHIIGVSGGGYAALLAYMKINYPVKSFNAWVPISNLSDWYWESKGRNAKYAIDIEMVAMQHNAMNWELLDSRSPMKLPVPHNQRKNATLNIYAGVHDGYTGSVPISHSILFYNKMADALYPTNKEALVPDSVLLSLITKQCNPVADSTVKLSGRKIHLQKHLPGLSLTIFEGGHEMLVPAALALAQIDRGVGLLPLQILTIGDSNGAFDYGWPQQLSKLLPYANIVNSSVSGNTIGFNNLDKTELNTRFNIQLYLDGAIVKLPASRPLDYIFICLGTNDAKAIFKDRQREVAANMKLLLEEIKEYFFMRRLRMPTICLITAPPMDEQKIDVAKYGGGNDRVLKNNQQFQKIANDNKVGMLNTYDLLYKNLTDNTSDGIHLKPNAQYKIAEAIVAFIIKKHAV